LSKESLAKGSPRGSHPFGNNMSLSGMCLVSSLCTFIWIVCVRKSCSTRYQEVRRRQASKAIGRFEELSFKNKTRR